MTTTLVKCACPTCACEVSGSAAVVKNHQSFCSDACASGHPNNEPCHDAAGACGCSCGSWCNHYWRVISRSRNVRYERAAPRNFLVQGLFIAPSVVLANKKARRKRQAGWWGFPMYIRFDAMGSAWADTAKSLTISSSLIKAKQYETPHIRFLHYYLHITTHM